MCVLFITWKISPALHSVGFFAQTGNWLTSDMLLHLIDSDSSYSMNKYVIKCCLFCVHWCLGSRGARLSTWTGAAADTSRSHGCYILDRLWTGESISSSWLLYLGPFSRPFHRGSDQDWCSRSLKPCTHWWQSWIQHGRLCWKSTFAETGNKSATKLTVAVYVQLCCRFCQQIGIQLEFDSLSRLTLLLICSTLSPLRSTLLPVCRGPKPQSTLLTFNKVDRVAFNVVANVYRALEITVAQFGIKSTVAQKRSEFL